MDVTFIDKTLNTFTIQIFASIGRLAEPMMYVLYSLAVIELASKWQLYFGENKFSELVGFVMKVGFFSFLITNWQEMVTMVMETFELMAFFAAGESNFVNTPTGIIGLGYKLVSDGFFDLIKDKGITSITITLIANCLVLVFLLLSFVFMALQIFLIKTEFILMGTISIVLLPFGVYRHSSFFAQKVFSYMLSSGIKMMSMLFLLLILTPILEDLISTEPTANILTDLASSISLLISVAMMAFMICKIPEFVANLLSGSGAGGSSMPDPIQGVKNVASVAKGVTAPVTKSMSQLQKALR